MAKEENIECSGVVEECLRGAQFRVKLDGTDRVILAHISGKIRKHNIHIVAGDKVTVELAPYNLERGIIKFRQK